MLALDMSPAPRRGPSPVSHSAQAAIRSSGFTNRKREVIRNGILRIASEGGLPIGLRAMFRRLNRTVFGWLKDRFPTVPYADLTRKVGETIQRQGGAAPAREEEGRRDRGLGPA